MPDLFEQMAQESAKLYPSRTKLGKPITNDWQRTTALPLEEAGYTVTSTSGGRHATKSRHYSGDAIDVRTNDLTPDEGDYLKMQLESQGNRVLDERYVRSANASGPHLHVERDDALAQQLKAQQRRQSAPKDDPFVAMAKESESILGQPQNIKLADNGRSYDDPAAVLNKGRTDKSGNFVLSMGEAEKEPVASESPTAERTDRLGAATYGKLVEQGKARPLTDIELANPGMRRVNVSIPGQAGVPPSAEDVINQSLRSVQAPTGFREAAYGQDNALTQAITPENLAAWQKAGYLRFEPESNQWQLQADVPESVVAAIENYKKQRSLDAVDNPGLKQAMTGFAGTLAQNSPDLIAGLEGGASGVVKTASNVGKLATLQNPQTAPQNGLDRVANEMSTDVAGVRALDPSVMGQLKRGLLAGSVTMPMVNELAVAGGMPAILAHGVLSRAHLSQDEQMKGLLTDIATMQAMHAAGEAPGIVQAGIGGGMQALGRTVQGDVKTGQDALAAFLEGAAMSPAARQRRGEPLTTLGDVRPQELQVRNGTSIVPIEGLNQANAQEQAMLAQLESRQANRPARPLVDPGRQHNTEVLPISALRQNVDAQRAYQQQFNQADVVARDAGEIPSDRKYGNQLRNLESPVRDTGTLPTEEAYAAQLADLSSNAPTNTAPAKVPTGAAQPPAPAPPRGVKGRLSALANGPQAEVADFTRALDEAANLEPSTRPAGPARQPVRGRQVSQDAQTQKGVTLGDEQQIQNPAEANRPVITESSTRAQQDAGLVGEPAASVGQVRPSGRSIATTTDNPAVARRQDKVPQAPVATQKQVADYYAQRQALEAPVKAEEVTTTPEQYRQQLTRLQQSENLDAALTPREQATLDAMKRTPEEVAYAEQLGRTLQPARAEEVTTTPEQYRQQRNRLLRNEDLDEAVTPREREGLYAAQLRGLERKVEPEPLPKTYRPRSGDKVEYGNEQSILDQPRSNVQPAANVGRAVQAKTRTSPSDRATGQDRGKLQDSEPTSRESDIYRTREGRVNEAQLGAIDRRAEQRQATETGEHGKISNWARKSFETPEGRTTPLALQPELRRFLGLPNVPANADSSTLAKAAQHTMDALAEKMGKSRSSEISFDDHVDFLTQNGPRLSDTVKRAYADTLSAHKAQEAFESGTADLPEIQQAIKEIEDAQAQGTRQSKQAIREKFSQIAAAYGLPKVAGERFANNYFQLKRSVPTDTARNVAGRGESQVAEVSRTESARSEAGDASTADRPIGAQRRESQQQPANPEQIDQQTVKPQPAPSNAQQSASHADVPLVKPEGTRTLSDQSARQRYEEARGYLDSGLGPQGRPLTEIARKGYEEQMRKAGKQLGLPKSEPKIITDARARLKNDQGTMSSGINPRQIKDLALTTGYDLYQAGKSFPEWSADMVKKLGEKVKPHLQETWDNVVESVKSGLVKSGIAEPMPGQEKLSPHPFAEGLFIRPQRSEEKFLRLGSLPEKGHSYNSREKQPEPGVSVYGVIRQNGEERVYGAGSFTYLDKRPTYEVKGDVVVDARGKIVTGSDGEPLLVNVKPVRKLRKGVTDWTLAGTEASRESREASLDIEKILGTPNLYRWGSSIDSQQNTASIHLFRENEKVRELLLARGWQQENPTDFIWTAPDRGTFDPTNPNISSMFGVGQLQAKLDRSTRAQQKEQGFVSLSRPRAKSKELVPFPSGFTFAEWQKQILSANTKKHLDPKQLKQLGDLITEAKTARADGDYGRFVAVQKDVQDLFRTKTGNLLSAANTITRVASLGGEVSYVGRQGGLPALTNTKDWLKSFKGFKAVRSAEDYHNGVAKILSHPLYGIAKEAGLDITVANETATDARTLAREENTLSGWSEKIPLLSQLERGNKVFIDALRMQMFDTYYRKMVGDQAKALTPAEATRMKRMAKEINILTGRGNLNEKAQEAADALGFIATSPRFAVSRFQAIDPTRIFRAWKEDPAAGKQILQNYARMAGFTMLVAGALKAGGASVSLDPEDADFLKLKMGNKRIALAVGGVDSALKMSLRLMSRAGEITNALAFRAEPDTNAAMESARKGATQLGKFARYKESPLASLIHDQMFDRTTLKDEQGRSVSVGRNAVGEAKTFGASVGDRAWPIFWQALKDAYQTEGASGIAATMPELLGHGAQVYESKFDRLNGAESKKGLVTRTARMVNGSVVNESVADFESRRKLANDLYAKHKQQMVESQFYKNAKPELQAKMLEHLEQRVVAETKATRVDERKLNPYVIYQDMREGEQSQKTRERNIKPFYR